MSTPTINDIFRVMCKGHSIQINYHDYIEVAMRIHELFKDVIEENAQLRGTINAYEMLSNKIYRKSSKNSKGLE